MSIFYSFVAVFLLCVSVSNSYAALTIAVIGAMDVEVEKLVHEMQNSKEAVLRDHSFYTGTMRGQNVVVTRSGVGKVNAAVTTSELITEFDASMLIFTGIAGAVHPVLELGDVVVSTSLVQHDVGLTAFGLDKGRMSGLESRYFPADQTLIDQAVKAAESFVGNERVIQGVVATGDQFITDKAEVQKIYEEFNALAVEMEGAAVAQVAQLYNTPVVVIRTISDKADGSAHSDYEEMEKVTAHNSAGITLKMLEMM